MSLHTLLLEDSTDHQAQRNPMTQITQHILIGTELFPSNTCIILLFPSHKQEQLTFRHKCEKQHFLQVQLSINQLHLFKMFPAAPFFLPGSYFTSAVNPARRGETLLIRFPMANHADVARADWNWDQEAFSNN